MRPTIRLGQFLGIDIGLHWSIAAIAGVLVVTLSGSVLPGFVPGYSSAAYLVAALVTAVLFLASIVAHELGHSLVARRNGVQVKGITLFALGGVATLDGEAASPGPAARIALAGPAVSVVAGLAAVGGAFLAGAIGLPALLVSSLTWLGVINGSLAVFNMLPALPLDGGRVLQAFMWHRNGDRHTATINAARVGRWIGWALVALGFVELSQGGTGLWTMLIGWFVVASAGAEGARARIERQRERQGANPFADLLGGMFGPGPAPRNGPIDGPHPGTPFGASWRPPRAEDRKSGPGPVIDVESRPVGSSH